MKEIEIRNRVVSRLQEWVGARKGDATHRAIIDAYNSHQPRPRGYRVSYADNWCAATVSAAAILEGLTEIMPVECSCGELIKLYKALGRWIENDAYVPQPGDLVMYAWSDDGVGDCKKDPNHVGMVERVDGNTITVIEGNMGSASEVGRRVLAVNGRYIRGYCCPDYASKADKAPVSKPWYAEAQTWAKELGITADGTRPTAPCTRAEVWQMLKNYDRASQQARRGD